MTAPTYRASQVSRGSAATATYTAPTRVAGDVLVAAVYTQFSYIDPPAGWTLLTQADTGAYNWRLGVYWRVASNTSADDLAVAGVAAGNPHAGTIGSYDLGGATSTPILGFDSYVTGAVDVSSFTTALTVGQDALLVGAALSTTSGTAQFTNATGLTERVDDFSGQPTVGLFDQSVTSGAHTETLDVSATRGGMVLIALRNNTPPNAPALVGPVGATVIDRNAVQRFSWTFSDPDVGDTQSAYSLRHRPATGGAWTTIVASSPNSYYDMPAGTLAAGDYEWQVATRDAQGLPLLDADLVYSGSGFFTAAVQPGPPSITAPVNGSTVSAVSATVTWSTPDQDAYQMRTVADLAGSPDTGTVYTDTGTVESPATRSTTASFAVNNRDEHIQVRIRDGGLWSAWASVRVLVSYTPPAVPTVTLYADNSAGSIAVVVTNPAPGAGEPTVTSHDILRREVGGVGIRVKTGLAAGGTFTDRSVASGVDYEYAAVSVGTNSTTSTGAWTGVLS